ncbi:GntR family transcriptional regulator [Orrella sp. 11846]|uniref:GntR family transcriptional regulator n=1 Tax=Orrella sp. 11846 TaxID=3409913 RepID=UPI003B5A328A
MTKGKSKAGVQLGAAAYSPLYRQIRDLLLQALDAGEWRPGDMIPSEVELAARYSVSQGTVRKAIDELAAEHIVIRRQGRGTFVATHQEDHIRFRFLRLTPDDGERVAPTSQILFCRRVRATAEIANALQLTTGAPLVFIRRVLSFEQKPTLVDDIYLPGALFKDMSIKLLKDKPGPLYWLFEDHFEVSMVRAEEKLRAQRVDAEIATLLELEPDQPVLKVERTSYTYGDRAVELRIGYYNTERYYYHNSLI